MTVRGRGAEGGERTSLVSHSVNQCVSERVRERLSHRAAMHLKIYHR